MISIESPVMNANHSESQKPRFYLFRQWAQEHMRLLSWTVPLAMFLLVIVYELGPARWIHESLGYRYHLASEILIFATLGPALAFMVLHLLRRWLDERETSDFQAELLARTKAEAEGSRQLNDDALQVLFAAGVLIDTLKAGNDALPPKLMAQVEDTETALQEAVRQLRSHLLKQSQ